MTGPFTIEQADAIARIVREGLHPGFAPGDDLVTGIEVKPMADGSGHWAVFFEAYDVAGDEHTFRTVVSAAGEIVGSENDLIPRA